MKKCYCGCYTIVFFPTFTPMKDLFGKAIYDFWTRGQAPPLITETDLTEADELPVEYLFRGFAQMPEIEQEALRLCRGKVLDAGCGAGCHSLYLQNEKKLQVTAIDVSPLAVDVCKAQGLKDARVQNLLNFTGETFDTVLLLMNGPGMCGRLNKLSSFLSHIKSLLNPGGQILTDSSDLIYLFENDKDGGVWIPGDRSYYGEVRFTVSYQDQTDKPFNWLYVDFENLSKAAAKAGLQCNKVMEGGHFDYLARLTPTV